MKVVLSWHLRREISESISIFYVCGFIYLLIYRICKLCNLCIHTNITLRNIHCRLNGIKNVYIKCKCKCICNKNLKKYYGDPNANMGRARCSTRRFTLYSYIIQLFPLMFSSTRLIIPLAHPQNNSLLEANSLLLILMFCTYNISWYTYISKTINYLFYVYYLLSVNTYLDRRDLFAKSPLSTKFYGN